MTLFPYHLRKTPPASDRRRDGALPHWHLLQVGGIGVLGLGLPELLRAGAPPAVRSPSARVVQWS
jgi:hypothetical protein